MKKSTLLILSLCYFISCKQAQQDATGSWLAPIEGMEPFQWGFTLNEDGSASSINTASLTYKAWHFSGDKLIVEGESRGNRSSSPVSDTFTLVKKENKTQLLVSASGVEYVFANKTDADNIIKEYETEYCYTSNSEKQSVYLRYKQSGNVLRGSMIYEIPGKDKSFGSLSGTLVGDTLVGNFDFFAEGTESYREVVLLRSGNSWKEATGEVIVEGNAAMFKSRSKLDFSKGAVLDPTACK